MEGSQVRLVKNLPLKATPAPTLERVTLTYTPPHLAEKILTSRHVLEGERKQVTVLFADLQDSTAIIEDLDPEAAQKLLDPALHTMMEAVHRYEGTVNQILGDGLMALFGAPLVHEDHALRACHAALRMQTVMQEYAETVRRAHGIEMRLRVGLNSGEVVVRAIGNDLHMTYSAVGQTTHLAARMEQLATPGTIRLTATTLRLVEGLVRVTTLGPIPVKGVTEPVEVFELTGVTDLRCRLQATVARGLTRLVGRQTDLEMLRQALTQAETGHGQVVGMLGEAGVGKSRLVYEMARIAAARGIDFEDTAFFPTRTLSHLSLDGAVARLRDLGDQFASRAPTHKVSTLQDMEQGKTRLEVEETLGYAVQQGVALGVPTPTLETCYNLIAAINRYLA